MKHVHVFVTLIFAYVNRTLGHIYKIVEDRIDGGKSHRRRDTPTVLELTVERRYTNYPDIHLDE